MKTATDEGVGAGLFMLTATYLNRLFNAKAEIKNNMSKRIISPVLLGFDFASLKDFTNKGNAFLAFSGGSSFVIWKYQSLVVYKVLSFVFGDSNQPVFFPKLFYSFFCNYD